MSRHALVAIVIVWLGSLALIGYYFARPYLRDRAAVFDSDAKDTQGTITVGVDNWVGYFPLCSREMKKRMRSSGYLWRCEDDKADYRQRMQRLKNRELQFAVATVDSLLLNGAAADFPGVAALVIDESKGGDALVARRDRFQSLEDFKTTQTPFRLAFSPNSPSEFLLRSIAVHFDIPSFRQAGPWRVETNGSSEALERLQKGDVDAAVLWEPDVSKALQNSQITKILGTEKTQRLIVDILLVERGFARDNGEIVSTVFSNYFRALKYYRDNPEELQTEIRAESGLSAEQVRSMLKGVAWATLQENASRWFGLTLQGVRGDEGLIDAIEGALEILTETSAFEVNPIPGGDPYRLQNRTFLEATLAKGLPEAGFVGLPEGASAQDFAPLTTEEWARLQPVGTLRLRPITYQSGTAELSYEGKLELDKIVTTLQHYPQFRVLVNGHTSIRGDAAVNKVLSLERAEAARRYLVIAHGLAEARLQAIGCGGERPLPRAPGEPERAYGYRLPRVELELVGEVF